MAKRTKLGLEIEAGLKDVQAHRHGRISLPGRVVEVMSAGRVLLTVIEKSPNAVETAMAAKP